MPRLKGKAHRLAPPVPRSMREHQVSALTRHLVGFVSAVSGKKLQTSEQHLPAQHPPPPTRYVVSQILEEVLDASVGEQNAPANLHETQNEANRRNSDRPQELGTSQDRSMTEKQPEKRRKVEVLVRERDGARTSAHSVRDNQNCVDDSQAKPPSISKRSARKRPRPTSGVGSYQKRERRTRDAASNASDGASARTSEVRADEHLAKGGPSRRNSTAHSKSDAPVFAEFSDHELDGSERGHLPPPGSSQYRDGRDADARPGGQHIGKKAASRVDDSMQVLANDPPPRKSSKKKKKKRRKHASLPQEHPNSEAKRKDEDRETDAAPPVASHGKPKRIVLRLPIRLHDMSVPARLQRRAPRSTHAARPTRMEEERHNVDRSKLSSASATENSAVADVHGGPPQTVKLDVVDETERNRRGNRQRRVRRCDSETNVEVRDSELAKTDKPIPESSKTENPNSVFAPNKTTIHPIRDTKTQGPQDRQLQPKRVISKKKRGKLKAGFSGQPVVSLPTTASRSSGTSDQHRRDTTAGKSMPSPFVGKAKSKTKKRKRTSRQSDESDGENLPKMRVLFDKVPTPRPEVPPSVSGAVEYAGSDASSDVDSVIDAVTCIGCAELGDMGKMVLCDACNSGCHTFCMRPPRTSVPLGAWMCPRCHITAKKHEIHLSRMVRLREGLCYECDKRGVSRKDNEAVKFCAECRLGFHTECLRMYHKVPKSRFCDPDWRCRVCVDFGKRKRPIDDPKLKKAPVSSSKKTKRPRESSSKGRNPGQVNSAKEESSERGKLGSSREGKRTPSQVRSRDLEDIESGRRVRKRPQPFRDKEKSRSVDDTERRKSITDEDLKDVEPSGEAFDRKQVRVKRPKKDKYRKRGEAREPSARIAATHCEDSDLDAAALDPEQLGSLLNNKQGTNVDGKSNHRGAGWEERRTKSPRDPPMQRQLPDQSRGQGLSGLIEKGLQQDLEVWNRKIQKSVSRVFDLSKLEERPNLSDRTETKKQVVPNEDSLKETDSTGFANGASFMLRHDEIEAPCGASNNLRDSVSGKGTPNPREHQVANACDSGSVRSEDDPRDTLQTVDEEDSQMPDECEGHREKGTTGALHTKDQALERLKGFRSNENRKKSDIRRRMQGNSGPAQDCDADVKALSTSQNSRGACGEDVSPVRIDDPAVVPNETSDRLRNGCDAEVEVTEKRALSNAQDICTDKSGENRVESGQTMNALHSVTCSEMEHARTVDAEGRGEAQDEYTVTHGVREGGKGQSDSVDDSRAAASDNSTVLPGMSMSATDQEKSSGGDGHDLKDSHAESLSNGAEHAVRSFRTLGDAGLRDKTSLGIESALSTDDASGDTQSNGMPPAFSKPLESSLWSRVPPLVSASSDVHSLPTYSEPVHPLGPLPSPALMGSLLSVSTPPLGTVVSTENGSLRLLQSQDGQGQHGEALVSSAEADLIRAALIQASQVVPSYTSTPPNDRTITLTTSAEEERESVLEHGRAVCAPPDDSVRLDAAPEEAKHESQAELDDATLGHEQLQSLMTPKCTGSKTPTKDRVPQTLTAVQPPTGSSAPVVATSTSKRAPPKTSSNTREGENELTVQESAATIPADEPPGEAETGRESSTLCQRAVSEKQSGTPSQSIEVSNASVDAGSSRPLAPPPTPAAPAFSVGDRDTLDIERPSKPANHTVLSSIEAPVFVSPGCVRRWTLLNVNVNQAFHASMFIDMPSKSYMDDAVRIVHDKNGRLRAVAFSRDKCHEGQDQLMEWWLENRRHFASVPVEFPTASVLTASCLK